MQQDGNIQQNTEDPNEKPQYRIRHGSSSQIICKIDCLFLNDQIEKNKNKLYVFNFIQFLIIKTFFITEYNRRDSKKVKERFKDNQTQASNSLSIQLDRSKQLNSKNSQEKNTISHNEKVAILLNKINGNNDSTINSGHKSMSNSQIIIKRANQTRDSLSSRLNTPYDKETLQNNYQINSKQSIDKSKSTQQEFLPNLGGSTSIIHGNTSIIKNKKSNSIQQGLDTIILQNTKQYQQTRFTSFEDIHGYSLESLDQTKTLNQGGLLKGTNSEYINIQQQDSHLNIPKGQRSSLNKIKLEESSILNKDNLQNRDSIFEKDNSNRQRQFSLKENINEQTLDQEQIKENYGEETDKIDQLNNLTTFMASRSQTYKNMYTNNDSRFKLINQLRNKNSHFENVITELKSEIDEVDEFKAVLDRYNQKKINEEEVITGLNQEKRIMLLKAQINKQQRHIRQLTSLLTSSRKSFKEVLDVCYFLLDNVSQENKNQGYRPNQSTQYHSHTQNSKSVQLPQNQKQISQSSPTKTGINSSNNLVSKTDHGNSQQNQQRGSITQNDNETILPKTEDAMQVFFNQVSQNQAHQQLLSVLIGVEDRRKFVDNFNAAFSKVIHFQYKSEEFKKLFTIKKNKYTQQAEVKFNHPLRLLFDQFQNCFPVHSLFDYLDSSQNQSVSNKLLTIMSLLRKTDRAFKKIRTYQLFKHNPICFKELKGQGDISVPNLLLENQKLFSEFMQPRGYSRMLSLNFNRIMNAEQSLGQLLEKMLNYLSKIQQQTLSLNQNRGEYTAELTDLVNNLRQGSEDLICLGILIPNDQGTMGQKISIIAESEEQKFDIQDEIQTTPVDSQQQQLCANEWFNYDKRMDINTEFIEKRITLFTLFEEFSTAASVKDYKSCNELVIKIQTLLESFKAIYESKDNLIKLKSFEIAYLKNQQTLHKQDYEQVQEFIDQLQQQINSLFSPINLKLSNAINSFTQLIDNSKILDSAQRQNQIFIFKKNIKEVLESIKKIQNSQFNSNQINIHQIEQQFLQKVQLSQQRFNRLKHIIQKPFKI